MSQKNIFWRNDSLTFIEVRKTTDSAEPYKTHIHDDYLSICVVETGKTSMTHQGKDHVITEGMVIFINPSEAHSCTPIDRVECSYWMIHLDIDWCLDIQKEMFGELDSYIPINTYSTNDKKIYGEFSDICRSLLQLDDICEIESEFINLVSTLFGKYCAREQIEVSNVVVQEVANYISSNMFVDLSLDCLADKFHQNRFHLLRSFKSVYGVPPMAFQMNLRIEHAKEMLRAGKSIADVAQETGFTDQSHFHRIFKKYVAATPGEYIKK